MRLSYPPKLEVVIWILKYTGEVSNTVKVIFFQYTNNHFFPRQLYNMDFCRGSTFRSIHVLLCCIWDCLSSHVVTSITQGNTHA